MPPQKQYLGIFFCKKPVCFVVLQKNIFFSNIQVCQKTLVFFQKYFFCLRAKKPVSPFFSLFETLAKTAHKENTKSLRSEDGEGKLPPLSSPSSAGPRRPCLRDAALVAPPPPPPTRRSGCGRRQKGTCGSSWGPATATPPTPSCSRSTTTAWARCAVAAVSDTECPLKLRGRGRRASGADPGGFLWGGGHRPGAARTERERGRGKSPTMRWRIFHARVIRTAGLGVQGSCVVRGGGGGGNVPTLLSTKHSTSVPIHNNGPNIHAIADIELSLQNPLPTSPPRNHPTETCNPLVRQFCFVESL